MFIYLECSEYFAYTSNFKKDLGMQRDTFLSEISIGSKKKNICDIETLWRAYVLITTIINTNNIVNCLYIVIQTVPVEITFKEYSKQNIFNDFSHCLYFYCSSLLKLMSPIEYV